MTEEEKIAALDMVEAYEQMTDYYMPLFVAITIKYLTPDL